MHWVLYNLPLDLGGPPEAIPAKDRVLDGALHGLNDFKRVGYGGPCPPPGKPHRYVFKLYALDTVLDVKRERARRMCCKRARGIS